MSGQGINSLIPSRPQHGAPQSHSPVPVSRPQHTEVTPLVARHDDYAPSPTPASLSHESFIHEEDEISAVPHYQKKLTEKSESIFQIEVEKIKPNPYQPRTTFNQEALHELAQSIREFGVLQPLVVSKIVKETPQGAEVEYQLVAGERRLMASKLIGLPTVPAIVRKVDTARIKLELALIENVQRSNLNPIESARAYSRLQDEFNLTQREIALRVGKSREVVANTLRLLQLPSHIQEALAEGRIGESHARVLLGASNPETQNQLFRNMLEKKTTVRELKQKMPVSSEPFTPRPEEQYWEKRLEEKLGAPAKIIRQGAGGKIMVQFYSEEEYRNILNNIVGEE